MVLIHSYNVSGVINIHKMTHDINSHKVGGIYTVVEKGDYNSFDDSDFNDRLVVTEILRGRGKGTPYNVYRTKSRF